MYLGDIGTSQVVYFHFTTRQFSTGAPITSASLAVSIYKDDSTTQSTSGVTATFSSGFDGVAGLVSVKIDTGSDGTFYAAGHDFSVVVTAGTADSVSIVGEVVATFSILNRSPLRPTTAGRTLDVSSGGEAGIDWANVGSPTTTVGLSGTTVKTATDVEADTQDIQSRLPAALTGGKMESNIGSITAGIIAAASFAANALDAVWAATTRLLTAGTNIVLAKGVGVTGFNDLSAAQVNAEAYTALADYDAPTHAELTAELATADDATLAALAAFPLKRNTPGQHVNFYMRDSSDPKLGFSGTPTVTVSIDGAAFAATTGVVTPLGGGVCDFAPSAADLSGVLIVFKATLSGAVVVVKEFFTHV